MITCKTILTDCSEQGIFDFEGWFIVQLSDDHRGTETAPGLVANLLPVEVYKDFVSVTATVVQNETQQTEGGAANCCSTPERRQSSPCGMLMQDNNDGIVHGVALKFAAADLETVISKLDYREKGGYSRILVDFFPLKEKGCPSGVTRQIRAFVYVGLPCNRYFYCFPDFPISPVPSNRASDGFIDNWDQETEDELPECSASQKSANKRTGQQTGEGNTSHAQGSTALLCRCCPDDLAHAAGMIVRGEGVSGPNTEYLFKLADFLRKIRQVDTHVFSLEARVKRLMRQQDQHDSATRLEGAR